MTWTHQDPSGLAAAVEDGLAWGLSGVWWGPGSDRAFRGYLLASASAQAALAGSEVVQTGDNAEPVVLIDPAPKPEASAERAHAARVLSRTIALLAERDLSDRNVVTRGSAPQTEGWPIAIGVAIVATAGVAGLAYCADRAAEVIDRQLSRVERLRMLVQRDAVAVKLVKEHHEQERAAGKALPLSAATRQALQATIEQQNEIVQKSETPLSPGIKNWLGSGGSLSSALGGFGVGAVVAAGVGLYILTR